MGSDDGMSMGGRVTYEDVAAAMRPSINTTVWTWVSAPPSSCRPCEQRSSLTPHQHGTTMWCVERKSCSLGRSAETTASSASEAEFVLYVSDSWVCGFTR